MLRIVSACFATYQLPSWRLLAALQLYERTHLILSAPAVAAAAAAAAVVVQV
jgi:hypothetical protein